MNDFLVGVFAFAVMYGILYSISYLCRIKEIEAEAQAKIERQRREAIRQAEERKKELEKERQIQEAKRKNPLYPAKPLRHIAYNDHETMRKILEELKANGKWPHKKEAE